MKIYKNEIDCGLESKILSSARFNIACKITNSYTIDTSKQISIARANPEQPDLYYLDSLLVSSGINGNDDVFLKQYLWAARKTPEDKKLNFMHNEKDIIGHQTSSRVIDGLGNLISEDEDVDNIPDEIHIVVGSVIYKYWQDQQLQERMDNLIEEIKEGKWAVSMECIFQDFDYALFNDKEKKIVSRNEETSYLTKSLRIYGGSGSYNNYRIGRVLKNFSFSGNGIVDIPANPNSVIFGIGDEKELMTFANYSISNNVIEGERKKMEINLKDHLELVQEAATSKADASVLKTRVEDMQKAIASVESKNKELEEKIAEAEQKNEELEKAAKAEKVTREEIVASKDEEIKKLEESIASIKEEKAKLEDEISTIKENAKVEARKAKLTAKVGEAKASELIEKLKDASDELFDIFVESVSDSKAEMSEEDKKKKLEKEKKEKEAKAKEDLEKAEEEVEKAKAEAGIAGGETETVDRDKQLSIARYIGSTLKNKVEIGE